MKVLTSLLGLVIISIFSTSLKAEPKTFEMAPLKGIAPIEVTLNAEHLHQHAQIFIWDFGNGETLTTSDSKIRHTFKNAGTFAVKLRYLKNKQDKLDKGKDGGTQTIVVLPNKLPQPVLSCKSDFINKIECNTNGSVDEDGVIKTFKYEWGDGTTQTEATASFLEHIYSSGGLKIISLSVTDDKSGITTISKEVQVKANHPPVANFECQKTGIQQISCESTSIDADEELSNFSWTLNDGTTYSSKTFVHKFSRPVDVAIAAHSIKLTVTDSYNVEDSLSKNIEVELEPIRQAPRAYFKIFMDGTTVDLRSFITRTQFDIKKASFTVFGPGSQDPIKTIELTDFHANTSTKFDLENYGGYRINLNVTDMRDQFIRYSLPFSLASDTSVLKPHVEFRAIQSGPRTAYINLNPTFDFDENYSIRSYIVNFGDGQQREITDDTFVSHTYVEEGNYTITVTAKTNHNTENSLAKVLAVTDVTVPAINPDPTFSYRIYDFAQNVSFYDERSGTPNGEIISYFWNFGDGTSGTGRTQAHFYAPGTYVVSLTVTDTAGFSNTQTQKITISATGDDIVANIDCNQRQPYLDITQMCKVNALDKFNEINRIRVVWGDGTVFTLATPFDPRQGIYFPQKKYNDEGTYNVRLIVNTVRGAFKVHDIIHTVTARRPVANLYCNVNNLLVFCDGLGSWDPKGTPLKYTFDFGNGHIEKNSIGMITYAYPEAGLYNVKLTVEDNTGLTGQISTQVMPVKPPNQPPIAAFNCGSPSPHTIHCWDEGTHDPDGQVILKKLEFDDGTSAFLNDGQVTSHQFIAGGMHSVRLIVIDNDGGSSSLYRNFEIQVNSNPVADFDCIPNGPQTLSCFSKSYDNNHNDTIVDYFWKLGDDTVQSGLSSSFTHLYPDSSNYQIELTVQDSFGARSTISKNFNPPINLPPVITTHCLSLTNLNLTCNSFAQDPEGFGVNVVWELDDEVKYFSEGFNHTFLQGGIHKVKLTAKDSIGAISVKEELIFIRENIFPIAKLNTDVKYGPPPLTVTLDTFGSNDPDGSIVKYEWIVNGISISNEDKIQYVFEEEGLHTVEIKITDNNGSISTKKTYIRVASDQIELRSNVIKGFAKLPINLEAIVNTVEVYDRFEWYHNGLKIGEGLKVNYIIEDLGNQKIDFIASSYDGFRNSKSISIEVLKPSLYIGGEIPAYAFVGHEYKAELSLSTTLSEETSINLNNAPSGFSFDSDNLTLNWIPTSNQTGKHVFEIKVYNGQEEFSKTISINVTVPKLLGSIISNGLEHSFTINNTSSDLNGANFLFKAKAGNEIRIFESSNEAETFLFVDSDSELTEPIVVNFPETRKVGIYSYNFEKSQDRGLEYIPKTFIERDEKTMKYCNEMLRISKIKEYETEYIPYPTKLFPYVQAFVHIEVSKDPVLLNRVLALLEDENTLNSLPSVDGYKLYFRKNYYPNEFGVFYDSIPDSLFLFPDGNINHVEAGFKYTLLHEGFHLAQNRKLGCSTDKHKALSDPTYSSISEGSADMFAYSKLDHMIPRNLYNGRLLTDREFAIKFDYDPVNYPSFPLSLSNKIGKGALNHKYDSRFVFDFYKRADPIYEGTWAPTFDTTPLKLDALDMIEYFNSKKAEILSQTSIGNYLLHHYALAKNFKLNKLLLSITDNFNNKKVAIPQQKGESSLIYHLNQSDLFVWDEPFYLKMPNNSEQNILDLTDDGSNVIRLNPMSGVSKNLNLAPTQNVLNHNYYSLLSYDHADDSTIDFSFLSSESFWSAFNSTYANANLDQKVIISSAFNKEDSRLRINIVNSGLDTIDIKIGLKSLCKSFDVPATNLKVTPNCSASCVSNNALIMAVIDNVAPGSPFGASAPNGALSFYASNGWFQGDHPSAEINLDSIKSTFGSSATFAGKILVCQTKVGADGIITINPTWTVVNGD